MESKREELQRELATVERGRGKRYPEGLLERVVSYAVERRKRGATLVTIGEELGISWKSMSRWIAARRPQQRFRRVEVVAPPRREVVVRGAHGVWIEGLDIDGAAELLRKLDS